MLDRLDPSALAAAGTSGPRANLEVVQRALPLAIVTAALLTDAAGAHALAFYLVLGAIVVLAHATLERYGALVDLPGSAPQVGVVRLQAALGVVALGLALLAAAVRAPALDGSVPALGFSALVASLGLLAFQGALRLAK